MRCARRALLFKGHDYDSTCEIRDCTRYWTPDSRFIVRTFAYLRDPLFVLCCILYALNRWALKPILHVPFLQYWFNDLLLIPCALPFVLWIQRRMHLRHDDSPPSFTEVSVHLLLWSLLFEVIGPHLFRHATGDFLDVLAYVAGGVFALAWWHRQQFTKRLAA